MDPLIKSQLLYQLSYAPLPDSDVGWEATPIAATPAHNKTRAPKESRRVGTRRLPYVGDRVGGLGVRPPALAP